MARARTRGAGPDDAVLALDPASRGLVAATAARRSELELQGAAAFTAATEAAIHLGADTDIVDLCARAIAEEIDHSRIYLSVARAYALEEVAAPHPRPIEVPTYEGESEAGQSVLRLVGLCAINETMACAFLQCCLEGATAPSVRQGLQQVLEDEIRHARVGWMVLGSPDVGAAERRLVSKWLAPMLRAQWRGWSDQIASLPPGECPEHGCPGALAIEAAARSAVRDIVLPGFARAGIDVSDAGAWFAQL